jgi:hypothetical protein
MDRFRATMRSERWLKRMESHALPQWWGLSCEQYGGDQAFTNNSAR